MDVCYGRQRINGYGGAVVKDQEMDVLLEYDRISRGRGESGFTAAADVGLAHDRLSRGRGDGKPEQSDIV